MTEKEVFHRKCTKCKSKYIREFNLIGATGRQCRICGEYWDNTEKFPCIKCNKEYDYSFEDGLCKECKKESKND